MHTKKVRSPRGSLRNAASLVLALALPSLAGVAKAQSTDTPAQPEPPAPAIAAPTEDEVVHMSRFTVDETKDSGYKASNSIAGTRSNTPIKEIPLNIQVFTKDLTDDLAITNQIELERYNAALVNGGADSQSDNPIQQAYNAFLFRGFIQNWGLRDGIRQYDPIDTQGLSRVEIVKGPAAPLYGLTYPGGVMNSISKEVDFKRNFSAIRLSAQSEGGYRGSIDANFTGKLADGRMGVRYNGAYAKTQDERDHSEGMVEFNQLLLNWQPPPSTEVKFLAETGYREKPNGLGYFTRGETASNGVTSLGNGADIPLQIARPDLHIPWEWNWATGNMRSIDTKLYRGTITQGVGENLTLTGYVQFSARVNVDSEGFDAAGGGGSAASWDLGWSGDPGPGAFPATGWLGIGSGSNYKEVIRMAYHHLDWTNNMHTFGATAVYKLETGPLKNTFTAGGANWREDFVAHKRTLRNGSTSTLDFPVAKDISLGVPAQPPPDYFIDGLSPWKEYNENTYYFGSWQGSLLDNSLRLNASINHTEINNKLYPNATTTTPNNYVNVKKYSPMIGAMYDINKAVSVFAVSSTSMFPVTDKNSFAVQMPPVKGKSYEGGVKVELLNGKISGTISYYQITQSGGAQTDSRAENLNTQRWDKMTAAERAANFPGKVRSDLLGDVVPGGEQESKGFEADLIFQPTPAWQIMLSYAHNDQEVTEALNTSTIGQSVSGHIKDQVAVLSKYSFREGSLKGLYAGMGMQMAGKALQDYAVPGGKPRYNPSTFYAEFFTGYKFKAGGFNQMIQFNAKNLTRQDSFVGWKATGSASVYSTERYRVPTSMRFELTYGLDF